MSPVKIRHTLIGGTKKMIVWNDLEPEEKVKVYDSGVELSTDPDDTRRLRVGYRIGSMFAPTVDSTEALRREALHFVDCVRGNAVPLTDGASGLRVIRILEAATRSIAEQGAPVELSR
jgi:predicted dehydrogenase